MLLTAGTPLGPYEIVAPLGAGGMGEVYVAKDQRLGREVAIKVLAERLVTDTDALARFEREARAIGALSHPNVVVVHDVGAEGSIHFVVMELLQGETLRARLTAAGRSGLPVRKVLEIAIQIASGISAAHARGIAHRDLKPENIFLTTEGRVKVLDFGLARLAPVGAASGEAQTTVISDTPLTAPGVVWGTTGYLAPEQIRERSADHRADLFAFGAVVFEMLSGARAFTGATALEVMNAVLTVDPLERRASTTQWPPALEGLVRHCLEKEPSERFQSAHDLGFQLQSIASGSGPLATPAIGPARVRARWTLLGTAAATLALGVGLGWMLSGPRRATAVLRSPITFALVPPVGVTVARYSSIARAGVFAVSPDGQRVVFAGTSADGPNQLFVRSLNSLDAKPIEGTTNAAYPFWAPDSMRIAFCSAGKLRRTRTDGGPVEVIADCTNPRSSGAWGPDDTILFAPAYNSSLVRVSASGGPTTVVGPATPPTQGDAWFSPVWLPDGRRFLVVRFPFDDSSTATTGVFLGRVDSPTVTQVLPDRVTEIAVDGGHLVMRRGEELRTQPFDVGTGRVSGTPRVLAQRVIAMSAASGTLVYHAPPHGALLGSRITWFSRNGAKLFETGKPGSINDLRLSANGQLLAVTRVGEFGLSHIWTYDLKRNVDQQVSSGGTIVPVWSSDPRYIVGLHADGVRRFDLSALGAPPQLILPTTAADTTIDWSPDGKYVALRLVTPTSSGFRLVAYPVGPSPNGKADPVPVAEMTAGGLASFSPDGHWIAYSDDHSGGPPRVYVSAFPPRGDRAPVTSLGAAHVRWRRDGQELFILTTGAAKIVAVHVIQTGAGIDFGPPRDLFTLPRVLRGTSAFDVSPDGQRFVFIIPGDPDRTPLTVVRDR